MAVRKVRKYVWVNQPFKKKKASVLCLTKCDSHQLRHFLIASLRYFLFQCLSLFCFDTVSMKLFLACWCYVCSHYGLSLVLFYICVF